jgi:hypothetical protein
MHFTASSFVCLLVALVACGGSDTTAPTPPVEPAVCVPESNGNVVARMISPVDGATLPTGAVTFTWCNASADYFLVVESVRGAHDIFFAFAGGAGGGAGVNTLTLGPQCAASAPTGCIGAHGESIFVTLYTLKQGNIVSPSPFQYTYRAAGP